ncbi:MAG: aminoacyl-tRNA hydrolase [Chlorobiaceae bacterium]|nr:aminoacyl-tRNA hydrolase [Chlorobiales bacterium]NTV26876.1 aminoacyl-tRNA hydrolase [Chlorobiaceae bacterium]
MKLIVGLGNPDARHAGTRHNIGFDVVDHLARMHGGSFASGRGNYHFAKIACPGGPLLLVKPMTYMNLSGQAVVAAMNFYKITREDLLVICDDVNIPLGSIRMRSKGSAGGQNGLKNIILSLGSEEFSRLRVGVGQAVPPVSLSSFVLSKFSEDERKTVERVIGVCHDAVLAFASKGVEQAMTNFNQAGI